MHQDQKPEPRGGCRRSMFSKSSSLKHFYEHVDLDLRANLKTLDHPCEAEHRTPLVRDIRQMSGCFLGPGSRPEGTQRPHKHTNSLTCGHLCITRAQVLYIEQWVELSLSCTCTDSETVRQRTGQTLPSQTCSLIPSHHFGLLHTVQD